LAGTRVRRAEPAGRVELPLVEVEPVDLARARDPRALDHREADGTAADHTDARALPHLRRLEDRADAGDDGAPDQARLLRRESFRYPNCSRLAYDRMRGEGAHLQRLREPLSIEK